MWGLCNKKHKAYRDAHSAALVSLHEKLDSLTSLINGLHFDNDIIKHQLALQEELRKCQDELNLVKSELTRLNDLIEKNRSQKKRKGKTLAPEQDKQE
jgi:hypothetical protein